MTNEMDDDAGEESNAIDNPGSPDRTDAPPATQPADFVVPPTPSETRISWTGLAAPEPVTPAEAPAAVAAADASTEIDASVKADAATTTEAAAAIESPPAAPPEQAAPAPAATPPSSEAATAPAATEPTPDAPTEKKVVWSSAPSSYGSGSYSSRRDDY